MVEAKTMEKMKIEIDLEVYLQLQEAVKRLREIVDGFSPIVENKRSGEG